MTKLIGSLIVSVFLAMIFMTCSKDEDAKPTVDIVGSWLLFSETDSNCSIPADNYSYTDTDGCDDGECDIYTFKKDGTYSFVYKSSSSTTKDEGTYTVSGNEITFLDDYVFLAEIKNNRLTLTSIIGYGCDTKLVLIKQ
jgi:hypothetical protein